MFFKKLAEYADLAEVAWGGSKENRLVDAVMSNHTGKVKEILRNNKIDWSNATIRANILLLSFALSEDNMIIINELLEAGIPVNARNSNNETILLEAIHKNNKELVRTFIRYGAKVNIRFNKGFTPLLEAIIHTKDPEMIKILIDAGAKIDAREEKGFPPIAFAANNGLTQIVDYFVKNGVHVDTRIGPGNSTTLTDLVRDSAKDDHSQMIKFLLSLGADPTIKDGWSNKSALDYAKEQDDRDLINLFKSSGYSI